MGAANTVRFLAGAALYSPLLLAEDLLRKAGMDIPQEGIFYNNEGKSMMQIFNEHAPEKMAPFELRQAGQMVQEVNQALEDYNQEVLRIQAKKEQILQMLAKAQSQSKPKPY